MLVNYLIKDNKNIINYEYAYYTNDLLMKYIRTIIEYSQNLNNHFHITLYKNERMTNVPKSVKPTAIGTPYVVLLEHSCTGVKLSKAR